MTSVYLGILLFSFFVNSFLMLPYINKLYSIRFQRQKQKTLDPFNIKTPIFDHFHQHKAGVPVGGGLLTIGVTVVLFLFFLVLLMIFGLPVVSGFNNPLKEGVIVIFTMVSFMLLGLFDDIKKTFFAQVSGFYGLRLRHKLIIQLFLSGIIAYWIYSWLGIQFINIPFLGTYTIGWWYIPFAAFVIVAFTNAFNITDGLDGLAGGVLMIALFTLMIISYTLLDTILAVFLVIWIGGLITFLYFNVFPARILMGDTGALSFGATFAVIGLLLGKPFLLPIIGFIFVVEVITSLIQLAAKRLSHRKFFPVAPLHLYLQLKGWEEPKIVQRLWLITIICTIFGLWIAFLK